MTAEDFSIQPDHDRPGIHAAPGSSGTHGLASAPVLVAITGATGSVYGLTLVERLLEAGIPVRLSFTKAAGRVVEEETGKSVREWTEEFKALARDIAAVGPAKPLPDRIEANRSGGTRKPGTAEDLSAGRAGPKASATSLLFFLDPIDDIGAPGASGSFRSRGMVIAPCSMGTLGRIAAGMSGNLIEREADVCLKERRPLLLLARETPLSAIHLRNMLTLTEAGAVIMPPVPAFYTRPETIDDLVNHTVDRALDLLGIFSPHAFRWGDTQADAGQQDPGVRDLDTSE